ncbi:retrovirus-related pol polyprotein from transposon TNT 1-94 [Tanacetum coccineum]
MTTLVEYIIVAGAENRPPMLEKSMYDSWESRIRLFIKGNKHGRMMLDSIDNGLLVYLTIEENRQTRPMKYSELTKAQQLQDDCDVQATNIILHSLPPDVYALVNHQEAAKDIWDIVKLLMKGTELSYQEHECRLFSQLITDMHTIGMTMQQVQVNTKFLNALPSEWSKFVTEQREDPVECINKAMAFLSVVASRFPPSNNQLRTSSNPRNQATIQDAGQPRVMKCYNCQREGHMARQCTQPKRPRNAAWFKEKLMLAEAQEAGQILDEEQLAFLADLGISEALVAQ